MHNDFHRPIFYLCIELERNAILTSEVCGVNFYDTIGAKFICYKKLNQCACHLVNKKIRTKARQYVAL